MAAAAAVLTNELPFCIFLRRRRPRKRNRVPTRIERAEREREREEEGEKKLGIIGAIINYCTGSRSRWVRVDLDEQ